MSGRFLFTGLLAVGVALATAGCEKKVAANNSPGTGPVATTVEPDLDANHFKVDHPEQFPLVQAVEYTAAPELNVTGVVSPDVSRQVPVPSLASGKVLEINTRLGDEVKKGQLLFSVHSNDISSAYADYRKAVKNEQLAKLQLDRAKLLYEDGAIPKSNLEIAQNADDNSQVDLDAALEHLKLLGSDPDHPTGTVQVFAPVSGVITDQQIAVGSGIQALTPPNPLTISDLSHVWIVCDVYENDMAQVHVGEYTDIHLVAYPDRVLKARISNIAPIIDPNIRTAKVRLEVENPGILRIGMFVTATFHGQVAEKHSAVPAAAILHLHDREWVYVPAGNGAFRRAEVTAGGMLPDNMQEIVSGLRAGDQVVANALVFQNTAEQ
jgi:cobalt-zinc-cadmium efflux system membrane fusion protein